MRVAFLAGHLSRRASGVRQMVEGLSSALTSQGVDVRVFGIGDGAWERGDRDAWLGAPALTLRRYGPQNLGFTPGLGQALRAFSPDIVHLHGLWMYSAAVAASWAASPFRALAISPHGMLAPTALKYSIKTKRLAGLLFQERCFSRATGFHATSEQEALDIRSYLGNAHIEIVPLGVENTGISIPAWRDRQPRVVALGRLHPVKGYENLLRAWAIIEPQAPDWILEISGPDTTGLGSELRQLIKHLGLARAEIVPPKYGAERDALLASSKLFVLSSLSENFALTVPEALICGTPVVASTGTPWEALVRQGSGWWVSPEPEQLAAALREAISLPDDQLFAMGAAGRLWAKETFGWDGLARQMTHFYANLLARASKR